jgi:DNA-binding transcriptional LysR family regulator
MPEVRRQRADWSDVRVFWAVVEMRGFGAASRALGLSQPTVTRRVEDLEVRLGAKLLVRGQGGVSLTEAGKVVYEYARTMEHSAAQMERMVLNQDRREEGRVILAAPDGVGGYLIGPAIPDFMQANPKITLTLDCGLWPDSPVSEYVDLSVQFADGGPNPDIVATPLAHFHYAWFASRRYLDLYGTPTTLQELAAHRIVQHSAAKRQPEGWGAKTAAFYDLAEPALFTNSSAAFVTSMQAGLGIGAMPTVILTIAPDLVMLDLPPVAHARLWVCHHRDIAKSARVARVMDWLQDVFDPSEQPWYRAEFIHPSEFGLSQPERVSAAG